MTDTPSPDQTIAEDLIRSLDLIPLIDIDSRGAVVCFGWVSPVREFSLTDLEEPQQ